jgi:putative nucleotidyltransferase with HDIG domain
MDQFCSDYFKEDFLFLLSVSAYNYFVSKKTEELNSEIEGNYHNIIELLATLIEIRDPYTKRHSKNVKDLSIKLAEAMELNLQPLQIFDLSYAALLHDIGKANINNETLNKKEHLISKEWEEITKHPTQGAFLVSNIPRLKNIAKIILHHHERFDGSGYPMGISGGQIPVFSRIISVADAYDAMTSDRAYRKALSKEHALKIIESETGKQFDPVMVKCFSENFKFIAEGS